MRDQQDEVQAMLDDMKQASRSPAVGRSRLLRTNTPGVISGRGSGCAAVDHRHVIVPYRLGVSMWQRQVLGTIDGRVCGGRHEGRICVAKITATRCAALVATPSNPRVNPPVRSVTVLACARPAPSRPAGYAQR
jgi:hypothetical protein